MKYVRGIAILLVIASAVGFFVWQVHKEKVRKIQASEQTLAEQKQAASWTYVRIQNSVTNLLNIEATGKEYVQKVEGAVLAVSGNKLDTELAKKYIPVTAIDIPSKDDEPAKTGKAKSPAPKPSPQKEEPQGMLTKEQLDALRKAQAERRGVDPKKPDSASPTPARSPDQPKDQAPGDEQGPPGEPTRAQLDALRRRWQPEPGPADEKDGASPQQQPGPQQKEPETAPRKPKPAAEKEPEIVSLARKIVFSAESLAEKGNAARTISLNSYQLAAAISSATSPRKAGEWLGELNGQLKILTSLESEAQETLFAMGEPLQKVLALQTKIEQEKEQQRLEEERRRKEEAHKKLLQEEIAAVGDLRTKNQDLVKQYQYDEALKAFTDKEAELQTDEAKNALKLHIERFSYLQKLKNFLIQSLNGRPYKWGWGYGPTAKDILGATEEGLKITGDQIAWTAVSLSQMGKIIEYCVFDSELDRKIRAEQTLAYGIFHRENGNADAAQRQLKDILDKFPTIQHDANRLLAP